MREYCPLEVPCSQDLHLSSNGFEQHITEPTHRLGNTLDLVITKTDDDVVLDWNVKQEIV